MRTQAQIEADLEDDIRRTVQKLSRPTERTASALAAITAIVLFCSTLYLLAVIVTTQ